MTTKVLGRRANLAESQSAAPPQMSAGPRPAPVGAPVGGGAPIRKAAPRQRKLPWVLLGVLLLAMSTLGFALWSMSQAQRTPVWVTIDDIEAGEAIDRGDLTLVNVGADAGLAVLPVGREDEVIGQLARSSIPAGTPLSAGLVVGRDDLVPDGQAVIGARLAVGQYPSSALAPGDQVQLVATSADTGEVVLGAGTIWAVEAVESSGEGDLFVSVLTGAEVAPAAVNAIAEDLLYLISVRGAP